MKSSEIYLSKQHISVHARMKWICLQGISAHMHSEKQAQVINLAMKTGMLIWTQEPALEFHEDFSGTWGVSTGFSLITRLADTEIIIIQLFCIQYVPFLCWEE